MSKRVRVLTAKMGLDCHDTGIVSLSQLLRDAGFEVIYLGLHNSAEKIIRLAQQEDVDIIGISFLSGQHMIQTNKLMEQIKAENENFVVLVGGVIPKTDIPELLSMGVARVFTPGTMTEEVAKFIRENIQTAS